MSERTGDAAAQPEPDASDPSALMRYLEQTIPAMDLGDAERLLLEAKSIFDAQGIAFFLRQGTCLGAVRDGALIPWDDDLDLGSIIGRHGLTVERIDPVAEAFRANDCYVEVSHEGLYTSVRIFKYRIRIDWQCYKVVRGTIAHYPGVPFPARLFDELSEVPFLGETFHVPTPVEEYLELKYGPDWVTPKQAGYEKDVLDAMPSGTVPGRAGRLRRFLSVRLRPSTAARVLVLDAAGEPVPGARVRVAGLGETRANRRGEARFYLPGADDYALEISTRGHEEVLYEEALAPGKTYIYRPEPGVSAGRYYVLREEPD